MSRHSLLDQTPNIDIAVLLAQFTNQLIVPIGFHICISVNGFITHLSFEFEANGAQTWLTTTTRTRRIMALHIASILGSIYGVL
jgi:hypothetical protein